MGERNMICTSQSLDMEIDRQGQDLLYPEPCFYLGNSGHYPHPNIYPMLPAPGNQTNIDLRHFPNNHESSVFYGSHFNGMQHHNPVTTTEFGVPSSFHNPCMIPASGGRLFPVPHVSAEQLPSSSHHGIVGVATDEFGANHFMDGLRGSGKRKNAEVIPGNYHQVNASESSSSSSLGMQPINTNVHQSEERLESGASMMYSVASIPPEYRVNGIPPIAGTRSGRSVRSRSNALNHQMESSTMNNSMNHFVQANYLVQSFPPSSWVEQQFGSTGNDGSTSTWNYTPAMPYVNGGNVNGVSSEAPNISGQGYSGTISSRNSAVILNPHMHHHPHPHHHFHPSPAMQAMHVHSSYNLQPLMPSFRHPTSNGEHHATTNSSLDDSEIGARNLRPFPSNGLRVYRPHRNGLHQTVSASTRPHLRFLSEDDVAILEFPGFYEVGGSTDRHRDMRLDIDDMSYEELLALGERIGNVVTGLPEKTISSRLRTKCFSPIAESMNHDDTETCVICQVEYKNQEKVGNLDCGHQYHVDCIKRWLQVKNVCPICKVPAINGEDGQKAM